MKFHVYITPTELHRQLTTVVDLPPAVLDLPKRDLVDLVRATIEPFTPCGKTELFKDYTVDGLREKGRVADVPMPAWLSDEFTSTFIRGHHPMVGPLNDFLWAEFLECLLNHQWLKPREWKTNSQNLGFPVLSLTTDSIMRATFGASNTKLRGHLPTQWTAMTMHNQGHLGLAHPGVINRSMTEFIQISSTRSHIFPARTHPLFYVALYEFWQYLNQQPVWAHLAPASLVDVKRDTCEFSAQSLLSLGLNASTFRWGWWALLSHVFAPRSRALDILVQYYPDCYDRIQFSPRPSGIYFTDIVAPPPRLRILNDPYDV